VVSQGYIATGWAALIDLEMGQELRRFDDGGGLTTDAIFSPDATQILMSGTTLGGQGVISLWDVATGEKLRDFEPEHTGAI